MVRKNRTANALGSAARVTLGSLKRIGHLLWLQVAGLFFLTFAVIGGLAAWHDYAKHRVLSERVAVGLGLLVVFTWFGLSSFWRAQTKA